MGGGILIVLILILLGLWKIVGLYVQSSLNLVPTLSPLPDNIEIIVPETERVNGWALSPEGDKIGYVLYIGSISTPFLLNPTTGQKQNLNNCKVFVWVDNRALFCLNNTSIVVSDEDTNVISIPLKRVKAADSDLTTLLENIGTLYKFECANLSSSLWLRDVADSSASLQNYLVEDIENIQTILQEYTSAAVPCTKPVGGPVEKVYSPDGMYYFNVGFTANDQATLTIHNATKLKLQ